MVPNLPFADDLYRKSSASPSPNPTRLYRTNVFPSLSLSLTHVAPLLCVVWFYLGILFGRQLLLFRFFLAVPIPTEAALAERSHRRRVGLFDAAAGACARAARGSEPPSSGMSGVRRVPFEGMKCHNNCVVRSLVQFCLAKNEERRLRRAICKKIESGTSEFWCKVSLGRKSCAVPSVRKSAKGTDFVFVYFCDNLQTQAKICGLPCKN